MLEREKQVAIFFWQLMMTHQSHAHLKLCLSTSCILMVAAAMDCKSCHIAKSSAWRPLEMSRNVGGDVNH